MARACASCAARLFRPHFEIDFSQIERRCCSAWPRRNRPLGTDLAASIHGAYATIDRRRFRLRNTLVVAQVALSLMLVVTASLFVRTLQNVARTDPGYSFANVALASIDATISGYREQEAVALVDRLQERLRGLDGVTAVSTARMIPLQGSSLGLGRIQVTGYQGARGDNTLDADWNIISPGYFDVVGSRLLEGRDFSAQDRGVDRRQRRRHRDLPGGAGPVGVVLAGVIGTLAQSLLVNVPAIDPIAFGGTAVLFAIVLAAACWTPARRAAATDPATALRAE